MAQLNHRKRNDEGGAYSKAVWIDFEPSKGKEIKKEDLH